MVEDFSIVKLTFRFVALLEGKGKQDDILCPSTLKKKAHCLTENPLESTKLQVCTILTV